jgi:hypothetical protein
MRTQRASSIDACTILTQCVLSKHRVFVSGEGVSLGSATPAALRSCSPSASSRPWSATQRCWCRSKVSALDLNPPSANARQGLSRVKMPLSKSKAVRPTRVTYDNHEYGSDSCYDEVYRRFGFRPVWRLSLRFGMRLVRFWHIRADPVSVSF